MDSFGVSHGQVAGEAAMVSRTGYTGEDGFEIYTLSTSPDKIWEAILEQGRDYDIQPIGLGARDTLRLEANLMLYGNDIDDTTTVLEAGLRWLVKFKKGDSVIVRKDCLLTEHIGKIGTITYIRNHSIYMYRVAFSDGDHNIYKECELNLDVVNNWQERIEGVTK